jgi:hypothetical protein
MWMWKSRPGAGLGKVSSFLLGLDGQADRHRFFASRQRVAAVDIKHLNRRQQRFAGGFNGL